jgi:hypothetical protein
MEGPPSGLRQRHSTSRASGRLLLLLLVAGLVLACASPEALPESPAPQERGAQALRVRLVFGEEADLDLYVTDPKFETVYFGNNPSHGGGVLSQDQRCGDPTARVESVTFAEAKPGLYRVGVAFARRCKRVRGPVPFRLEVDVDVESEHWRREQEGKIDAGAFLPVVMEFDLE